MGAHISELRALRRTNMFLDNSILRALLDGVGFRICFKRTSAMRFN